MRALFCYFWHFHLTFGEGKQQVIITMIHRRSRVSFWSMTLDGSQTTHHRAPFFCCCCSHFDIIVVVGFKIGKKKGGCDSSLASAAAAAAQPCDK